jgi:hypothetical protein
MTSGTRDRPNSPNSHARPELPDGHLPARTDVLTNNAVLGYLRVGHQAIVSVAHGCLANHTRSAAETASIAMPCGQVASCRCWCPMRVVMPRTIALVSSTRLKDRSYPIRLDKSYARQIAIGYPTVVME